jgi:hypothetical protein
MECEDSVPWKEAIEEKYSSIIQNNTWTVEPLPQNRDTLYLCTVWFFIQPVGRRLSNFVPFSCG